MKAFGMRLKKLEQQREKKDEALSDKRDKAWLEAFAAERTAEIEAFEGTLEGIDKTLWREAFKVFEPGFDESKISPYRDKGYFYERLNDRQLDLWIRFIEALAGEVSDWQAGEYGSRWFFGCKKLENMEHRIAEYAATLKGGDLSVWREAIAKAQAVREMEFSFKWAYFTGNAWDYYAKKEKTPLPERPTGEELLSLVRFLERYGIRER